jgi:plasmid stability protein
VLALADLQQAQMPEEQTYQMRLRAAAAGKVGEADVEEIVAGIVQRAKDGDKHAIDQFFVHVLGVKNAPTKIVNNLIVQDVETGARVAKANGQRRLATESPASH